MAAHEGDIGRRGRKSHQRENRRARDRVLPVDRHLSKTSGDVGPRLLNLHQAGAYLNVSYWSARDYVLAGLLPTIHLPPLRVRKGAKQKLALRRVLVDRADLDAFVESRKVRRL